MADVTRTSNFHFARMRQAEDAARRLSVRHTAQTVLAGLTGIPHGETADMAAVRDSYYQLAAAHRSAGRKRERAESRALAWAAFREDPARYVRAMVRIWAYSVARAVTR